MRKEKQKNMDSYRNLYGKKLLSLSILLLLTLGPFSALDVKIAQVSAVDSPYIAVLPENTLDLTPGDSFTVGIYTNYGAAPDYSEYDVTSYEFTLYFNPLVLNITGVAQGDIIVGGPATFIPTPADNTAGNLSARGFYDGEGYITSMYRPFPWNGTLAYVTFTVVDYGASAITIGPHTRLIGWNFTESKAYNIIEALTMPTHMQHGYFDNRFPHNVAIGSVGAPVKAAVGSLVPINVEVANTGASDEVANVTIRYGSTLIGFNDTIALPINHTDTWKGNNVTKTFDTTGKPIYWDSEKVYVNQTLMTKIVNYTINYEAGKIKFRTAPGLEAEIEAMYLQHSTIVSFSWNTTGLDQGIYTIDATATIPDDGDSTDNWNATTIFLAVHNVAVPSVTAPVKAAVGSLVPIDVEVANTGASDEVANVTIRYGSTLIGFNDTIELPAQNSTIVPFEWNTAGVIAGDYNLTATATVLESVFNPNGTDDDPNDNWNIATVLIVQHDMAIKNVSVTPATATPGDIVSINVTATNTGASDEVANVTIRYGSTLIGFNDTIELPAQNSTIVPFNWNTTGLDQGIYTINATATILESVLNPNGTDDDPNDNWNITTTLLAVHDVAVKRISAPTSVYVGEIATIRVQVETGWYNETFEVKVTHDIGIIGNQSVTLLSMASEYIEFSWDTVNVAPASYNITAEAILDLDQNLENNLLTSLFPIVVKLSLGTVFGTVTDASTGLPIAGANVAADDYTNTTGGEGQYSIKLPPGTYNVTASATKYVGHSKTGNVSANTTTTLDFELTPLNGTIFGTVTDSLTGDPIAGANVTTNGIFVSTGTDGSYSIELPPGTYKVAVSVNGYKSASEPNITVPAGETTTVDFELTPIQSTNFLLYAGVAAIAMIVIAAIAVYIARGRRKPK